MSYEITISGPDNELEASFVPELGMIHCSLRHRGEECLHQGHGLAAYAQHGATYANPLLHPWANRLSAWEFELDGERVRLDPESEITHRDGATGTAIHGLLAASPHWQVLDADRHTLTAELDFGAVPQYMAAFPFAHRLRYAATIDESRLVIELTLVAGEQRRVPVSFGFHPYLTLPGSERAGWDLQIPVAREVLIDERMIPSGSTAQLAPGELDGPLAQRTFDTGYDRLTGEPPWSFSLADARRRITLTQDAAYPAAQIYTPDAADFICFEPMTAPTNALISGAGLRWVDPGERFTASFTLAVEQLG